MNTYFLSDETINAYLRDLLRRLSATSATPDLICAVTKSGIVLLERFVKMIGAEGGPEWAKVRVASFGKTGNDEITTQGLREDEIKGSRCLLIDSAVHTGRLMSRCRRKLVALEAEEIFSYALVIKRCSQHIPTFWGLMIDEVDRTLFSLDTIPNNRLSSSDEQGQQPVTISMLDEDGCTRVLVKTDVDSMDRITWSDRLFDMLASPSDHLTRTYLLEKSKAVIGYLTIHLESNRRHLVVDEVALDKGWQRQKLGGVLLRFACTLARHHNCTKVRLNAIEARLEFYEGFSFKKTPGREPLKLDGETYFPMEKSLLHAPLDGHDPEV